MAQSMTGYGKGVSENKKKRITVEIKSLNSKQTDINARIPGMYREKEIEIRSLISNALVRGKIDVSVFSENLAGESSTVLNEPVIANYYKQVTAIGNNIDLPLASDMFSAILRLPDSLKTALEAIDDDEWKLLMITVKAAIANLIEFREQEGAALLKEVEGRIKNIIALQLEVEKFENERVEAVRKRISDALDEVSNKVEYDKNRFEQEMIYYLEKFDVTEEKVRLDNHCNYFLETLATEGSVGKKLGFITQEIGREINTLGSKANHSGMQQVVVLMKDELEKVKEQILNIL